MLQVVVIGCILFCLWKLYSSVVAPYFKYREYLTLAKKGNYRVLDLGFVPFVPAFVLQYYKDRNMKGDSLFTAKDTYHNYDLMLCNFRQKVYIQLINKELIKQFYAHENKTYHKENSIVLHFERLFGQSLILSEGERWKTKRKSLTHAFNYNYLKQKHGKIV